ncbi:hypothetical protein TNIN_30581 [Trichonephila inaurata madagascariensis]|uniref:C2H2-type domain-containing protein n=1 Tax=Trichonephila inaurata madagascariensis TaxID=2747483 RepID=A0A8X6XAF9_9ARAC|nr:hypothetical protein TNIN_30581 [Trichonephila inaurata madagascariensis]
MSTSNSSLMKCFNVYSKETPSEQNIPSRSLSNKENEIGYNANDEHTNRIGSVEKNFQENSSSVEKSFNEKPELVKDPVTRTGRKPRVCEICAKTFKYKSRLKTHYGIHFAEKPHKCDV